MTKYIAFVKQEASIWTEVSQERAAVKITLGEFATYREARDYAVSRFGDRLVLIEPA